MAWSTLNFFSKSLELAVAVNVVLPEGDYAEPPKVLYLLHGLSDDYTIWQRRTSVERYANRYNLMVIMPDANRSFYANMATGQRYWDYVSKELPQVMARYFKFSRKREDTFVCGLSMGGYGALKLALSQPNRFAKAASFSGAVDVVDLFERQPDSQTLLTCFGSLSALKGSGNDLIALAKKTAAKPVKPELFLACGTADFLFAAHEKMGSYLESLGYSVIHSETENIGHTWDFWDPMVEKAIQWMMEG